MSIYGYSAGNPWEYMAPIDADRNICGYSPGYEDYPDLFIADILAAINDPTEIFKYGVCVKECPSSADSTIECMPTQEVQTCQPSADNSYGSDDVFSYCVPDEDTLSPKAQENYSSLTDSF